MVPTKAIRAFYCFIIAAITARLKPIYWNIEHEVDVIHPSTFSIVAFDAATQSWGVAVASKFPAVGALVPWARAGSGAVATQALANTSYGPNGLELLSQSLDAETVLNRLLAEDSDKENRQLGLVDSQGRAATFTGQKCMHWAGGLSGDGYAIQGNILAGPQVVEAMEAAFHRAGGEFAGRLHTALLAGDRAGGDRRGRQSAALIVVKAQGGYGGYTDRMLDYRVDDDSDPVLKLGGLVEIHYLYFGKSPESERLYLNGEPLHEMQNLLQQLGYLKETSGVYDPPTRGAFRAFTGNENFEERCDPSVGWIDRPVYDYLLRKFGK